MAGPRAHRGIRRVEGAHPSAFASPDGISALQRRPFVVIPPPNALAWWTALSTYIADAGSLGK